MARLKAVLRFRTSDDPEFMKSPLKILMRAWRVLKTEDPGATLRITRDDQPIHYDPEGD